MKNIKKILWIVVLFYALNLAYAMGISPAYTNLAAEQAEYYSGKIWIINNEQTEFKAKIYVQGEMSQFISILPEEITLREDDEYKIVDFQVNLKEIKIPGLFNPEIVIEQLLDEKSAGVNSKIMLSHKLNIQGSFPDKYVKTKLNFREEENNIIFISEVENLGKADLNEVKTKFYVNDKKVELESDSTSLKTKENKLLTAYIGRELFNIGEYEVTALTIYDNEKISITKNLILGQPEVEINYFTNYFIANIINKFYLELNNKWNKPLQNVYADIEVYKDEKKVSSFRTKSIDLQGLSRNRIEGYFDAREKEVGKYDFWITVNYQDKSMEKKLVKVELISEEEYNKLNVDKLNNVSLLEEKVVSKAQQKIDWLKFFGVLGGLNIIGLIYVLWRYKNREEGENAF